MSKLQMVMYVFFAVGATAEFFLILGNTKNNILNGVSFVFIILGVILSIINSKRTQA